MKLWKTTAAALFAATLPFAAASAQTVKVGLILTLSGPDASIGQQMDRAVQLYLKEYSKNLPAGVKVEIVKRDDTGNGKADVAKRLAEELIARDKVQILAGVIWTPNAMGVAPVATEGKTPFVVMNAATSVVSTASPYIVRTSMTIWQSAYPMGGWAAKNNLKNVYIATTDYAPGTDALEGFTKGLTEAGGTVAGSVRMPIANPDFVPFLQRIKDAKPQAVFTFVPGGPQATSFMKTFTDLGLPQAGVKLIGTGDITDDYELPNMGDAPLGVITTFHYSAAATRPANQAFVQAWKREYGDKATPNFFSVGAWDGMAAIFHAVAEQKGRMNADKTMELLRTWKTDNSPRGTIMIDPETRDIVQNEYVRRVEKVNGQMANVEFDTIPAVKDPWKIVNNKK